MSTTSNAAVMALPSPAIDASYSVEIELKRADSAIRRSRVCTHPDAKETALIAAHGHALRAAWLIQQLKS